MQTHSKKCNETQFFLKKAEKFKNMRKNKKKFRTKIFLKNQNWVKILRMQKHSKNNQKKLKKFQKFKNMQKNSKKINKKQQN